MAHGDYNNYQGKNFAPIESLRDAKRTSAKPNLNPSSSNAFFRELYQGLINEHDTEWREVLEQGRIISNLAGGKLIMKRDLGGTGYVFLKPLTSARDRSNSPVFPQNCEILKSKWAKARPAVNARFQGDGYKTEIQMNLVNTAVRSYFADIFTPQYEINEAISALEFGTYITQFEYDDKLNQMRQIVPIIQNQSKVLVDGYGACYDCGMEGKPEDFAKTGAPMPQCPECESFRTTEMIPEAVADEQVITDIQEVVQGDLRGRLIPFPACRYDPRVLAHDSGYFIYSERIPLRLLRSIVGEDLDIAVNDTEDIGLQIMDSLSIRGGSTENNGESAIYNQHARFVEEGTLRSMYLKPEMYAGFKLTQAEKTLGGTIPKGVPFEEIFPEGLCIRGFNDMRVQVGYHAQKANLVGSAFLLQSFSGIGKGVADAVDTAKDLNELHSMAMAGLKRYGASGLLVDSNSGVTASDARNIFKPRKVTFVDTSQNNGRMQDAVMQIMPPAVNPVLTQYAIQLNNMISLAFMTGDFAQGMTNDVDIDTLGGQQLAHAKAEEQKGAILTMKVFHRCKSAEILTELMRRHIKIPRYYAHDGDRQGTSKGKFISGSDMPETIKFLAVPDSEIPQNTFEKQSKAREMVAEAGGLVALMQAAQADPRLTGWYAKQFGAELPTLNEEEMQIVCLARLANIKELAEMFPDPNQILASLSKPLRVRESLHLLKADFISQILDDDEVAEWNPVAVATVELLIETHLQLEAEAQVRNQMIMTQAQAVVAGAQAQASQAIAQPQMEQERAMMQEDQEQQMMQEVGGKILEDEQKQVDYDREEDAKDQDLQRSIALEEAKAKLAPKPAKGK